MRICTCQSLGCLLHLIWTMRLIAFTKIPLHNPHWQRWYGSDLNKVIVYFYFLSSFFGCYTLRDGKHAANVIAQVNKALELLSEQDDPFVMMVEVEALEGAGRNSSYH